jgi:hypothetical protein
MILCFYPERSEGPLSSDRMFRPEHFATEALRIICFFYIRS